MIGFAVECVMNKLGFLFEFNGFMILYNFLIFVMGKITSKSVDINPYVQTE